MKKLFLLPFLGLSLVLTNCGKKTAETEQNTDSVAVALPTDQGATEPAPADSTVLDNAAFKITTLANANEPGEKITVFDKAKNETFNIGEGASYYSATVDNFILIDNGTGSVRTISIYNLNDKKSVFSSEYYGEIKTEGKTVSFGVKTEIKDKAKQPKCPTEFKDMPAEQIGFLEQQSFNLADMKLTKSGKFECAYFE